MIDVHTWFDVHTRLVVHTRFVLYFDLTKKSYVVF